MRFLLCAVVVLLSCGRSLDEVPEPAAGALRTPGPHRVAQAAPLALPHVTPSACAPTPAPCTAAPTFDPQLVSDTLSAPLIFVGTVKQLDASTEPSFPSTTARPLFVVSVDQLLYGEALLNEVTLDPQGVALPAVGESDVFFVQQVVDGVGVVALELHRVAPGTYPNITSDVPEIRRIAAEIDLYTALISAERVAVADVQSVASAPAGANGSEHDPMWTDADVALACVLRGPAGTSEAVRFPASIDIAWFKSPKLTVGEQTVLLLHPATPGYTYGPSDMFSGEAIGAPGDALAMSELQHVVNLLACPPSL
jgi:hypothetical protein